MILSRICLPDKVIYQADSSAMALTAFEGGLPWNRASGRIRLAARRERCATRGNWMPPETITLPARSPASRETRRLYAGDWAAFATWCRAQSHNALPAEPVTVAAYLESLAPTHSYGALARRIAAIADQHRRRGIEPPATDPRIRALLRAARATEGRRRKPPPSTAQLARWAAACAGDRAGQRDRALLLLMAAGLGRSAVVNLDAEDIRLTTPGMELTLRSTGDPGALPRILSVDRDPVLPACPVRALEDWMRASETLFGPVFRKVDRWGNIEHHRLCTDAIRGICQRWSRRAEGVATRHGARRTGAPPSPAAAPPP
jgi:hypothetical protein